MVGQRGDQPGKPDRRATTPGTGRTQQRQVSPTPFDVGNTLPTTRPASAGAGRIRKGIRDHGRRSGAAASGVSGEADSIWFGGSILDKLTVDRNRHPLRVAARFEQSYAPNASAPVHVQLVTSSGLRKSAHLERGRSRWPSSKRSE